MIDWQASMYDPIYNTLGVQATLASSGGQSATVTVIDKTSGIVIADARTQIDTILPVALVRARELENNAIAVSDLSEGEITFNGATWRIKSYRLTPSPLGEMDGEVRLILENVP